MDLLLHLNRIAMITATATTIATREKFTRRNNEMMITRKTTTTTATTTAAA